MAKKSAKNDGFSTKSLRKQLDESGKFADWAAAANARRSEFKSDVVGAVIAGYVEKFDSALPGLLEAAEEARTARAELVARAAEMETTAASVESQIDELKLRHAIGELDSAAFEAAQEEARAGLDLKSLENLRKSVADIDGLLEELTRVQSTMAESRGDGAAQDAFHSAPVAEAPVAEVAPAAEAPADEASEFVEAAPIEVEAAPIEVEAAPIEVEAAPIEVEAAPVEVETASVEVEAEAEIEDAASSLVGGDFSLEGDDGEAPSEVWDVDMPGASPAAESAEPAVVAEEGADIPADEPQDFMATGMVEAQPDIELPPVEESMEAPPGEGTRLVVSSPGAEPVVYPFNGEVMSLGRGRNNDVQIKNDGKISRYHCRIFRRGDEYVVEDNKSSNGTLVNGKLVTRQRLDGGEQVQVGETRVLFCAT